MAAVGRMRQALRNPGSADDLMFERFWRHTLSRVKERAEARMAEAGNKVSHSESQSKARFWPSCFLTEEPRTLRKGGAAVPTTRPQQPLSRESGESALPDCRCGWRNAGPGGVCSYFSTMTSLGLTAGELM